MIGSDTVQQLRRTAIRYLRHGGLDWDEAYLRAQAIRGSWAFIHINKCGGTSVEHALNIPKIHDTAQQRRDRLGQARWDALTSFSIVRHPYPRVRSLYHYRIKTDRLDRSRGEIGLDDWIRATFAERDPLYYDKPQMLLPARAWLTDTDDSMMVDFVARLEEIGTDWPRIQALIGSDAELPMKNTTRGGSGAPTDGLSRASLDTLAEYFDADFESFGYQR